jgi:hypothetical protein
VKESEMKIDPSKFLALLFGKNQNDVKLEFQRSFTELANIAKEIGREDEFLSLLNSGFHSSFKNLSDISRKVPIFETKDIINEDFKRFWEFFKFESWPILTIFPSLQVWFEIDKLLFGNGDINEKKLAFYGTFWLLMITGNFVKQWNKWRKEHPEEYEKEGSKKNPFSLKETTIYDKIEKYMVYESQKRINPNKYDDYDEFFKAMLKRHGIKNVRKLDKESKKEFFKEVEIIWKKRKKDASN